MRAELLAKFSPKAREEIINLEAKILKARIKQNEYDFFLSKTDKELEEIPRIGDDDI